MFRSIQRLRRKRRLCLAVLATLAACVDGDNPVAPTDESPALGEQQEAALAIAGQRILFTSRRNGNYDVYRTDPQGSPPVRITSFKGDESSAAYSWDNKRIAMVRFRMGSDSIKRSDIYLMNADGSNKRWVRSLPSTFGIGLPSWSPDGTRLVVVVVFADGGGPFIATMDVATGNMAFFLCENQLLEGYYPSYHPNGQSIVYVGPTFASIDRCQVGGGGDGTRIVQSTAPRLGRVNFSPDGKKIVYNEAVGSNYNSEIFVKDLTNGSVKRLTNSSAFEGYPAWSSDGSRIVFVSKRSGQLQLWTMNSTTGGGLTRITHTQTEEFDPAWSH